MISDQPQRWLLALALALAACGDSAEGGTDAAADAANAESGPAPEDAGDTNDAGSDAATGSCGDGVRDDGEACDATLDACCMDDCSGVLAAGAVCRPAAGACDVAETCDGTAPSCPANVRAEDGTECRAAAGPCDVAESCNGEDSDCPRDRFVDESIECRAAADACDVAELCPGDDAACPDDVLAAEDTPCDDGVFCNGADVCNGAGACTHPGTPCTVECSGICNEDTDACDPELDGLACSVGQCDSGACCPPGTQAVTGGCGLGGNHRIVFVTSQAVAGDLGGSAGIADADALCNELAAAANLAGTFSAWLSDDKENAKDRIGAGPFHRVDDTEVAKDVGDLVDGILSVGIDRTELGAAVGSVDVWTGTASAGTVLGAHCAAWSTAGAGTDALYGCTNATNGAWTHCGAAACDAAKYLYCFQDD